MGSKLWHMPGWQPAIRCEKKKGGADAAQVQGGVTSTHKVSTGGSGEGRP